MAWEEALSRSRLPIAGLDAVPPKPRFAIAAPLGAAIPGEAELADVWLIERMPAWRVREALAAALPDRYTLLEAWDVWLGAPALPGQVTASRYRVTFAPGAIDPEELGRASEAALRATSLPRERRKGQGMVRYDLRPFLDALEVGRAADEAPVLRMTLRHDPERGIGRPDEVLAELAERVGAPLEPHALVRESLVLAPPPAPAPPQARGPRARRQVTASPSRPRK